jgi:hypothetical protein
MEGVCVLLFMRFQVNSIVILGLHSVAHKVQSHGLFNVDLGATLAGVAKNKPASPDLVPLSSISHDGGSKGREIPLISGIQKSKPRREPS